MTKERCYFIRDLWNSYKSCREAVNHDSDCNSRERNVAYRSGQTLTQRICVKLSDDLLSFIEVNHWKYFGDLVTEVIY